MTKRMFSLGERLSACAEFVRKGSVAADIGTDHAKLPIWLVANGIIERAIASDINEGPIERAKSNIEHYGFSDKITAFIGDGLASLTPDMAQDIIIAGMGGELIAAILERAQWLKDNTYRLILQPMTHPEKLRAWLYDNGFDIIDEKAVLDANKLYTVICAEFCGKVPQYDLYSTYAGRLAEKADDTSRSFLEREARKLCVTAEGLRAAGSTDSAQELEAIAARLRTTAPEGEE